MSTSFMRIPIALSCMLATLMLVGCRPKSVDQQVEEALALAQAGGSDNWQKACGKLEWCLQRGVEDPNVVNFYIMSLDRAGKRDQAIQRGIEFHRQHPEDFMCNYLLGKMYFDNDRADEAIVYLRKCHRLQREHVDAAVLYASCASRLNLPETKQVMTALAANLEFKSSAEPYNELAIWHVHRRQYRHALSYFSKALKLSGGHPSIYLNLARLTDFYMKKPQIAHRYYINFQHRSNDTAKRKHVQARLKVISKLQSQRNDDG